MISNELHDGQGLGNQLWNYVLTRIIADKRQCGFSIHGRERFKGKEFMDLDFGAEPSDSHDHYYKEKTEYLIGTDIDVSRTDPKLLTLSPSTKFDGNCQSTEYLEGQRDAIKSWVRIKPEYAQYATDDNVCVIHFRAGDFRKTKDVFLPAEYYKHAMDHIRNINQNVRFCCVTDEKDIAEKILPGVEIIGSATHDTADTNKADHHRGGPIGIDFSFLVNARYLIIPNSSFSWWAAYLNDKKEAVVAPKYWARHNVSDGYWSTSDIITDGFTYLDRDGVVSSADECHNQKAAYQAAHPHMFSDMPAPKTFLSNLITRLFPTKNQYHVPGKIYDAFIFFNELDLLEIRLNLLDQHVDYFVLVEATQTFTGKTKPLYYQENKACFEKWNHKILHYVVDNIPESSDDVSNRLKDAQLDPLEREILETTLKTDNIPQDQAQWLREFYQKESIRKALVGLSDFDICFISDVDEIWNPNAAIDYTKDAVFKLRQDAYAYYLNNRSSEEWAGTFATRYKNIRNASINHLDTPTKTSYQYVENGGWHFTNMGGAERIRQKLESYGHQEFNNDKIKAELEAKIASNQDFIGRGFRFWVDETNLPEYIINNRTTYQNLFK